MYFTAASQGASHFRICLVAVKAAPQGRQRPDGIGRHKQQYRMNVEQVDKKLNLLSVLESTNNMRATILQFYSNNSDMVYKSKRIQIYNWKKAHQKLLAAAQVNKSSHRKIRDKGTATLLTHEQEVEIAQFVNELREEGVPVSTTILTMKAKEVAVAPFSASGYWVDGFKARHIMSVRAPTRQGQQSPADLDAIATAFAAQVDDVVRQLGVKQIYNADQTGINACGCVEWYS